MGREINVGTGRVTLVLPWRCLCPDNRRATLHVRRGRPVVATSDRYRAAKQETATRASAQMRSGRHAPFPRDCALALVATLYPPDRRRRDVVNLAKNLHDAIEGVCYADDAQLADVRYVRGPVDRDDPRVELSLTPLA